MKEHRFLNKVDFTIHPNTIPNNNEGNLYLYRLFALIRDSFELKHSDNTVGFPETLNDHIIFYKALIATMELRGLRVPRSQKSTIEKMLNVSLKVEKIVEPITVYHCPNCGGKLTKSDIDSYICGECYGRLPGYSDNMMQKPFANFDNWDACITHMTKPKSDGGQGYDEETAKKVCGKLQSEHEGK